MRRQPTPRPSGQHPSSCARSRGFTLIEVVASIAILGIFMAMVGSFMGWQLRQYANASSNFALDDLARGAIALFRDDFHQAGWGQAIDANAYGWTPTGECLPADALYIDEPSETNCTGRDEHGNSDRLRIVYGRGLQIYVQQASNPSLGPCVGSTQTVQLVDPDGISRLLMSQNDLIFVNGTTEMHWNCFFLSGACVDGSDAPASSTIFCLDYDTMYTHNDLGCEWVAHGHYKNNTASPSIGCTKGWKPGWNYSYLDTVNYSVIQDSNDLSFNLWRHVNSGTLPVVRNISHFQIAYALDLSVPMDGKLDDCSTCGIDDPYPSMFPNPQSWCRDLNGLCNLKLSDGSALTKETVYNRILAAHISFQIFDTDPNQTRTYRTTIALKNRITQ